MLLIAENPVGGVPVLFGGIAVEEYQEQNPPEANIRAHHLPNTFK